MWKPDHYRCDALMTCRTTRYCTWALEKNRSTWMSSRLGLRMMLGMTSWMEALKRGGRGADWLLLDEVEGNWYLETWSLLLKASREDLVAEGKKTNQWGWVELRGDGGHNSLINNNSRSSLKQLLSLMCLYWVIYVDSDFLTTISWFIQIADKGRFHFLF